MKNGYNHKIITIINQNDSNYGNKMENKYIQSQNNYKNKSK